MQPIDLENVFTYHPPTGREQVATYQVIRLGGKTLAELIDNNVPDGPEKTTAIRKIQEAVMWANAGIACAPPPAKCLCGSREAWAWAGKAGQEPGPHHSKQCDKWQPYADGAVGEGVLPCGKTETSNDTGQDEPVIPPAPQG
jgi:hypothetical protein